MPAVAHTWQLTPSPAPSTIADPEELARPRENPDPEPECALRQLTEASAEARQRPHLPRTEGQGSGEGRGLDRLTESPPGPQGPPGLTPIQNPSLPGPGLSPSPPAALTHPPRRWTGHPRLP